MRRYAWTARLPVSILSDFEEFVVYDCRLRPFKTDKPATARTMFLGYQDYAERWDELSGLFSPDAIQRGALERYVESTKTKKGTTAVDDAFLEEISRWRDLLAKNIALRNPRLSTRELNFAVQRTIDRLIFLRICEDRGIESYAYLQSLLNGERVYARLLKHFRDADDKYNSGLFCFTRKTGTVPDCGRVRAAGDCPEFSEGPDLLSLELNIDDKPLKDIIGNLYYPDSPYEFSVMPADVLGQVYEQFLGKVIRLTAGHQAKVEEKPEVRKAGGVYYTPTYIVDYIVKNTVGKLLEGKTPRQAEDLRILDPACGSGSFLLGAYQYLLDWHLEHYVQHKPEKGVILSEAKNRRPSPSVTPSPSRGLAPSNASAPLYQDSKGNWRLTTTERKRILLNNVYGVDIDSQAVEVTKLSLLLKVLEGENQETLKSQLKFFHERALPDLGTNIKCGNSLIGPDFYQGEQQALFADEEERLRVNTFDWNQGFPDIMKAGGFDAVIGNPPWGSFFSEPETTYLRSHYASKMGEAESHLFFIERAHKLLSTTGRLGFITPNTWLTVLRSREIRELLLRSSTFYELYELSKYVFADAPDIVPLLIFLGPGARPKLPCVVRRANITKITASSFGGAFTEERIAPTVWREADCVINMRLSSATNSILESCRKDSVPLSTLCDVLYGIKTGDNPRFLARVRSKTHSVKALKTGEIGRYRLEWKGLYLWWSQELAGYRTSPVAVPKIVVQYIRKISLPRRIIAVLDEKGQYYPLNNYSYIAARSRGPDLKYILGIVNSSLMNFYFANTFLDYNIKPTYLQQLPIRVKDPSVKADKTKHDKMIGMVETMLKLHKDLPKAKTPHEQESLQRQIAATDKQIDGLVYDLYGLSEEEIGIVEDHHQ